MTTSRRLLTSGVSDEEKLSAATRLWVVATLIGLILQIPVYALIGIDWKKPEFYLPGVLMLLLMNLVMAVIVHLGFRIHKIESNLPDTMVVYAITVGTYSPFIALLLSPALYDVIDTLKLVKQQDPGLLEVFGLAHNNLMLKQSMATPLMLYRDVANLVVSALVMVTLALFVHCISGVYTVTRHRVIKALGMALGVFFPIPSAIALGYYAIIYAAI